MQIMDTTQTTYSPAHEGPRLVPPTPDGLSDDLAQALAEERVALRKAEQQLVEAQMRTMIAEGELAALRYELRGLVERVRICTYRQTQ
jgi:ribosomal protein L16 Arg81 hydroxylase